MTDPETRALLGICVSAAFADGAQSEAERESLKAVFEKWSAVEDDLPALYGEIVVRRPGVAELCAPLANGERRELAYEMALGVCQADGALCAAEERFLEEMRGALGLGAAGSAAASDELAALPEAAAVPAAPEASPLDRTILHYAILAGALEMLPSAVSTMAILPLQIRLVYTIASGLGANPDRTHIKEFIATAGLGLTSQVVEGYAAKLLRGILGGLGPKFGGKTGQAVGAQVASSAISFATTYGIGHVAKAYYAAGRKMDAETLRAAFTSFIGQGRELQPGLQDQIEARSRTLDAKEILTLIGTGKV
jgi:uncharacterized tellurite resistance protein B-like protein/uncharacterized protein (DUF697 family)